MFRAVLAAVAITVGATTAHAGPAPARKIPAPTKTEVEAKGFADLHLHQMSALAFGGKYIHGKHDGPLAQALPSCSGHSLDGHGAFGGTEGGAGNLMPHGKSGAQKNFDGWPRWNTTSHQQAHAEWLKRAHTEGLSLIVMSAVHQGDFCKLLPAMMKKTGAKCDDLTNIKLQIDAAKEFEKKHAWYRIAYTPADARRIIAKGKLAVVLGLETSNAFDLGKVQDRVADYVAMGIRSFQPVHELNNKMGGAAWHAMPIRALQTLHNLENAGSTAVRFAEDLFNAAKHATSAESFFGGVKEAFSQVYNRTFGMELDGNGLNVKGLSQAGKTLVEELIAKKMLIDVSHMSQKGIGDALALSAKHAHYPLFSSHTHIKETKTPEEAAVEWAYPTKVLLRLAATGGVFGLRSDPSDGRTYTNAAVVNDCPGSTKSFAQIVEYATKELGLDVALASDFNGWATNSVPRFGKEACTGGGGSEAALKAFRAKQQKKSGTSLDTRGFGHVGLEGALLRELKGFGVDTSKLERSAETFIRMWERAHDAARQPITITVKASDAVKTMKVYVGPKGSTSAIAGVMNTVKDAFNSATATAKAKLTAALQAASSGASKIFDKVAYTACLAKACATSPLQCLAGDGKDLRADRKQCDKIHSHTPASGVSHTSFFNCAKTWAKKAMTPGSGVKAADLGKKVSEHCAH